MSAKQLLKTGVVLLNTDKIIEDYILKSVSSLKSAVVFYYPNESVQMTEVLKAVEVNQSDDLMSDNRVVILNTSKFSHDELSILSYNISRLNLFDIVEIFENGVSVSNDLFKRKTQPVPYDESNPNTIGDQEFLKLIDELAKSNPKASQIQRKHYLVNK